MFIHTSVAVSYDNFHIFTEKYNHEISFCNICTVWIYFILTIHPSL